jgi:hypothetical protein
VKPLLFAELARRRLRSQPLGPPPPELQQAKVDFIEAVINRNYSAAQAANAVIARYARPELPLSAAERAKRDQRHSALVAWVVALRELRDEEARGAVGLPPTPEQLVESRAVLDRLTHGILDDDSAGQEAKKEEPQP